MVQRSQLCGGRRERQHRTFIPPSSGRQLPGHSITTLRTFRALRGRRKWSQQVFPAQFRVYRRKAGPRRWVQETATLPSQPHPARMPTLLGILSALCQVCLDPFLTQKWGRGLVLLSSPGPGPLSSPSSRLKPASKASPSLPGARQEGEEAGKPCQNQLQRPLLPLNSPTLKGFITRQQRLPGWVLLPNHRPRPVWRPALPACPYPCGTPMRPWVPGRGSALGRPVLFWEE